MAVTYTGNLKLGLPTTGTESGTWGDVVNNQITTLVDQSISGTVSLTSMTNADYTLTNGNGNAANEARYMALLVPSSLTLTANRNIIVPSTSKLYVVKNATTGGFSVTVKTSAGTGIEVPNGNTMLLYCDGTNVIVAFDTMNTVSQNGGQLAGLRNRIINGGMTIDQRNGGAVVTPPANTLTYTVDRFAAYCTQSSKLTVQQNAGAVAAPTGFGSQLTVTSSSAYAVVAGDIFTLSQSIEGANLVDLAWGTVNAKTVALSFWVRSSLTGVFSGSLTNATQARSYPYTYTINSSNTWEYKTVVIPGDTTGTWATNVGIGIQINWSLGVGSTFQATANTWTAGNKFAATGSQSVVGTSGATFFIVGVQLEVGTVATPFEQRPIGMELGLCQRYLPAFTGLAAGSSIGVAYCGNSTLGVVHVSLPVVARIAPTGIQTSGSFQFNGAVSAALTSFTIRNTNVSTSSLNFAVASGLTAGQAGLIESVGSGSLLFTGCEL